MPKRRLKLPTDWIDETAHAAQRTLLPADGLRRVSLRRTNAVRELYDYNPETGIFRWRVDHGTNKRRDGK